MFLLANAFNNTALRRFECDVVKTKKKKRKQRTIVVYISAVPIVSIQAQLYDKVIC